MKREPGPARPVLDPARRYVRVTREHANGFVEFDFALGEPDVFLEMILDRQSFDEFCAENGVEFLPPDNNDGEERDEPWSWRLSDARDTRFK